MPGRRLAVPATALIALTMLTAGCSNRQSAAAKRPHTGSGSASQVAGHQQVTVRAGADLRFHPSRVTVHTGLLQVVLVNTEKTGQGAPHNLHVDGVPSASVPLTAAGERRTLTFTAPQPGTYRFVCTIHEAQGQTGTLVVKG